jgi:cell division protein FtsB
MILRAKLNKIKPFFTLNNGVVFLAMLVAAGWVWNTIEAIQRNFDLQQQVDGLKQEIAVFELQNKTIEFQNKYFESDEYLELSARERLNKAIKDEKLLILPQNTPVVKQETEVASQTPITSRSNFEQWMYFLFGDKS